VILSEPQPTPYDLRWRMFGIGVRVHWMFWLVAVWLSWNQTLEFPETAVYFLPLSVLAIFVSILIHEMGHVVMGRIFGSRSHIVLHAFGGLAISNDRPRDHWKRILISLAGPGAQFLLLAIIVTGVVVWHQSTQQSEPLQNYLLLGPAKTGTVAFVQTLIYINFFWPVLNLLPVWPLDGGQVCRSVCESISPVNGTIISLQLSLGLCVLIAGAAALNVLAERTGNTALEGIPVLSGLHFFHLIFFGMFAYTAYQALQYERAVRRYEEDDPYA